MYVYTNACAMISHCLCISCYRSCIIQRAVAKQRYNELHFVQVISRNIDIRVRVIIMLESSNARVYCLGIIVYITYSQIFTGTTIEKYGF